MEAIGTQRPFSMKLIFSIVCIGLVFFTVIGVHVLNERNARQALLREMESRLLTEGRYLALLSSDILLTEYPELTLCRIVHELMQSRPDLLLAVVLDHEGLIRGHHDVRRLDERFAELDELSPISAKVMLDSNEQILMSNRILAAKVPARHPSGQIVGTVVVGQNRDHLDQLISASRSQVTMLAAILGLIAVLLALMMVRRLLSPLDILRAGLVRIGQGVLDRPINLRSRTELGLLGESIDTMAAELRQVLAENRAREQEIIDTQREIIHTLGEVVESRSQETGNHIDRVAGGCALLAALAGLPPEQCHLLRMSAPMHDIGKIGIPDAVLNKPGKLTPEEFALMQTHTTLGHQILAQSTRPILQTAAVVSLQHHERWDGLGYPNGISGEDIHICARILSIIDVFEALTADRCYRPALPLAEALGIMTEGRGSQFDPDLLDLFLANFGRFRDLLDQPMPADTAVAASSQDAPEQDLLPIG